MENTKSADGYTTTPTLLNSSYAAFAQRGAAKNRHKNKCKKMCVEEKKKRKKQEKEKEKSRHAHSAFSRTTSLLTTPNPCHPQDYEY